MIQNAEAAKTLLGRLEAIDSNIAERKQYVSEKDYHDAKSSYSAGESGRMNPIPSGVDPLGTDADYHYQTERNYFLMVERGRAAVRNHPLVESGINRLIANVRLGDFRLDVSSTDEGLETALQDKWLDWSDDKSQCDFEQVRTFGEISRQSFFSQVVDGDILHLPLFDGSLQTWEGHHLRSPFGHRNRSYGSDQNGIIHGVEIKGGRTVAYHLTPFNLAFTQTLSSMRQSQRYEAFDAMGNQRVFWKGFTHRFGQRRGVSKLSPPRDAMNGFDDLNYAGIKSALRRALISYIMESNGPASPDVPVAGGGAIPKSGDRYAETRGLGLESVTIEQLGEAAQVFKSPEGYTMKGWNANMPGSGFFEQGALLLTMLATNLDIPLSFLLLDGSLVNFHGGRMTFDQVKMRMQQLQTDQISGLHSPTFKWKLRQWTTPGSLQFDPAIARAAKAAPPTFKFRPRGWPYTKPLEDWGASDLAEKRNLKSARAILADIGVDEDEHQKEIVKGRANFHRVAIREALEVQQEFPEIEFDVPSFYRELMYGNESSSVESWATQAVTPEVKPTEDDEIVDDKKPPAKKEDEADAE